MSNKVASFLPISGGLTVSGNLTTSGNINALGFSITASAYSGTITSASYAGTSSLLLGSIVSASYSLTSSFATTASFALNAGGFTPTGSFTGSFTGSLLGSASFATTASAATSITFVPATASYALTASVALNAGPSISSSFATYAYTASYATASFTGSNTALNAIGAITASQGFSGSIQSASFASMSYTALTASAATSITFTPVTASYAVNAGTAQNANFAPNGFTITGSLLVSGNTSHIGYAVTASFFSGSIASASFASSSYTTLTASAANSLTFTVATASYAVNAGTAQNANFAPNGFTVTGTLAVSGNINDTGYSVTASFFKGDGTQVTNVISSSYALTASYASLAQNVLGSITSASYALTASYSTTSSYATVAQNVLGSITSASYASTASYATPVFITSGTLGVTGSIQLNSAIATASLQLLSNKAAFLNSGSYIELFDAVTDGDANKGNVNIAAGISATIIPSGSTQAGINFITSGTLQWRIGPSGNLDGMGAANNIRMTGSISASALSGSGTNITGIVSSSYALTASFALNGGTGGPATSASFATYAYTASYATASFTGSAAAFTAVGAITASLGFSGSIASASFASSSYTTLTASAATSITFIPVTASYAVNAGAANNASFAPAGFTITGSFLVSGNANLTGYAVTASTFSGSIASASFASSSYTTLTASAATSITFPIISASYATNAGAANNASFAPNGFTITGSLLVSGNTSHIGYAVTASAFSGSIASASFASSSYTTLSSSYANTSSLAITASFALSNAGTVTNATSASFATYAYTASYATASWTGSTTAFTVIGDTLHSGSVTINGQNSAISGTITVPAMYSGNLAQDILTINPYITASTPGAITFIRIAVNATGSVSNGTAFARYFYNGNQVYSHALNGDMRFTDASSSTNFIEMNPPIGQFIINPSGSIIFTSSGSIQTIGVVRMQDDKFFGTASLATSASFATSASWAPGSGQSTSASYASTASVGAPGFFVSGTTTYVGSVLINNFTASNVDVTITGSTAQSGSIIITGGNVTASLGFSGSIASASFASSSYTTLTASAATSITFIPTSASYAITSSYATVAQNVLGSITSASYAGTASVIAPFFNVSGTLQVTGTIGLNNPSATASLQLLSNAAPTYISGAFIELFDVVTNGDDQKGDVNIWAGLPQTAILSGSQGAVKIYTSGNLQWIFNSAGNLDGTGHFLSASALSGSGANVTGVISSSYALTASFASNAGGNSVSSSYASTASAGSPTFFATSLTASTGLIVDQGQFVIDGPNNLAIVSSSMNISGNIVDIGYAVTASAFSGSIASSSFASSSYTTLTASYAVTASLASQLYSTNASAFAITGGLNVSGNINATGYQITGSQFNFVSGGVFSQYNISSGSVPLRAGTTQLIDMNYAGRNMASWNTPEQENILLQPAVFRGQQFDINVGGGASLTAYGTQTSTSGTITHIGWNASSSFMAAISTSAAVSGTALVQTFMPQVGLSGITGSGGGFFYNARIAPFGGSASYAGNAAGTTGSRLFVGLNTIPTYSASLFLADQTSMTASCIGFLKGFGTADPTAPNAGTNWQFHVGNKTTSSRVDTAMPFDTGSVYDMTIFVSPYNVGAVSQSVGWRIERRWPISTSGSIVQGGVMLSPTSSDAANVGLYAGAWLLTYAAGTVPFGFQSIYVETSR